MKPEQALARARAELERQRAAGAYDEDLSDLRVPPEERLSIERLMEWGVIEPDLDLVTSTRRYGAPIGWVKRFVEHLLRQYHRQLESQQTRFNLHLLTRIAELEDRIADLEQSSERVGGGLGGSVGGSEGSAGLGGSGGSAGSGSAGPDGSAGSGGSADSAGRRGRAETPPE